MHRSAEEARIDHDDRPVMRKQQRNQRVREGILDDEQNAIAVRRKIGQPHRAIVAVEEDRVRIVRGQRLAEVEIGPGRFVFDLHGIVAGGQGITDRFVRGQPQRAAGQRRSVEILIAFIDDVFCRNGRSAEAFETARVGGVCTVRIPVVVRAVESVALSFAQRVRKIHGDQIGIVPDLVQQRVVVIERTQTGGQIVPCGVSGGRRDQHVHPKPFVSGKLVKMREVPLKGRTVFCGILHGTLHKLSLAGHIHVVEAFGACGEPHVRADAGQSVPQDQVVGKIVFDIVIPRPTIERQRIRLREFGEHASFRKGKIGPEIAQRADEAGGEDQEENDCQKVFSHTSPQNRK